jgi:hypothetical protein
MAAVQAHSGFASSIQSNAADCPGVFSAQKLQAGRSRQGKAFDFSLYFFTQAFVASSHFMSFIFSHSAFVFGASAANAGAVAATTRAATIAVLRILNDI